MPTENRSSNTEMVSKLLPCPFCGQQDFLIERLDSDASVVICQGLTGPHEACLARGPVGVAQDEGEEQPGRDKAVELWNARAEQHQGEPVAWRYRVHPGGYWFTTTKSEQADLYRGTDDGGRVEPLYTHPAPADPGEVERLREQVETLRLMTNDYLLETERLRAQLADRYARFASMKQIALDACADLYPQQRRRVEARIESLSDSAEQQVKS